MGNYHVDVYLGACFDARMFESKIMSNFMGVLVGSIQTRDGSLVVTSRERTLWYAYPATLQRRIERQMMVSQMLCARHSFGSFRNDRHAVNFQTADSKNIISDGNI